MNLRLGLFLLVSCLLPAEQIVWEARMPFRDAGRIRVAGGLVITGNTTGRGGTAAFDNSSGKMLWRVGAQQRGGPIPGPKAIFTANHRTGTTALDPRTGKILWHAPEAELFNFADLAYDGLNLYVLGATGKLWVLDPATGKLRWEHVHNAGGRFGASCSPAPVPRDGIVVYSAAADGVTYFLWGLDPATGKEVWRAPGICAQGAALSGGIAVVTSGASMAGIDVSSGKVLWRSPPMSEGRSLSPPVISGSSAYAVHEHGLVGFDIRTGRQEFDFPGTFPDDRKPRELQIAGGKAYFIANFEQPRSARNPRGFLYAVDLATKQIVLRHRVNRDTPYEQTWDTQHFRVDGDFVYYENASLLVKLRQ